MRIDTDNNYYFWKNYLINVLKRLERLILEKEDIYVDLHIHSNYSIDSSQSLVDIIERAKKLGLDVISITDHDSIKVYDELYDYLSTNEVDGPIVIPGVEFTIDNQEYGNQFHILQYMINPKSEEIMKNIEYQDKAGWNRAKIQLDRLNKNKAMNYFFKKYNYSCTLEEYSKYLDNCFRPIPEYKTMMDYIRNKTYHYNISNWDILVKMEEYNEKDTCVERKKIKEEEFKYLKDRFDGLDDSDTNERFFHRLLATRRADDDFFPDYEGIGDLSVNRYSELSLNDLNKKYFTVFAHPSDNKLSLLRKLVKENDNLKGIELNKRCKYESLNNFYKVKEELCLIKTIGSDSHDKDSDLYEDINFYKYNSDELKVLVDSVKNYIDS